MKKILIVSSSNSFIERNDTLLRRSLFQLFSATTAVEAAKILQQESVDLVLIDIHLTDMDGEAFCRQIRNNEAVRKPFILLVCQDSADEFARLKLIGADALLARPIMPLQLIKTVGQFLTVQLVRSRRVSLRVKVRSMMQPDEFFCLSHNISITGMMLETDHFLETGSTIVCQFNLPGSTQIETEGEIVRSTRSLDGAYQYGICFTALSRHFRQEIDGYIAAVVKGEIPSAPGS
jgi:response regulator RpfG family c-di-GMP phosphodiesterase